MSPDEFKTAIDELGYSQVGISRRFGVNDRTGRRWASGEVPIPEAVSICLGLMLRYGLTPEVEAIILAKRVGQEFGQRDEIQYRWVLPKYEGAQWAVARYYFSRKVLFLPEAIDALKLEEVHLGPRVHEPVSVGEC